MEPDRRRRPRLCLRYQLRLWRGEGQLPLQAETDNISISGFYCIAQEPCSPGDNFQCELYIPNHQGAPLILNRRVRVVRVEIKGLEPGFGVACEFTEREKESGEMASAKTVSPWN
jgi:hypothetical protein